MNSTKVNVYKSGGEWFYALVVGGEVDHSDPLDIDASATDAEAIAAARAMCPGASVQRIDDI